MGLFSNITLVRNDDSEVTVAQSGALLARALKDADPHDALVDSAIQAAAGGAMLDENFTTARRLLAKLADPTLAPLLEPCGGWYHLEARRPSAETIENAWPRPLALSEEEISMLPDDPSNIALELLLAEDRAVDCGARKLTTGPILSSTEEVVRQLGALVGTEVTDIDEVWDATCTPGRLYSNQSVGMGRFSFSLGATRHEIWMSYGGHIDFYNVRDIAQRFGPTRGQRLYTVTAHSVVVCATEEEARNLTIDWDLVFDAPFMRKK